MSNNGLPKFAADEHINLADLPSLISRGSLNFSGVPALFLRRMCRILRHTSNIIR